MIAHRARASALTKSRGATTFQTSASAAIQTRRTGAIVRQMTLVVAALFQPEEADQALGLSLRRPSRS